MITRAERRDLPQLTRLWQDCFGDRPEDIAAFWRLPGVQVFCARENGRAVSMASALPVQLIDEEGEAHAAAYLYAVATDKTFRRRGLCGEVLHYAEVQLKKSGVEFSLLIPSTPPLFSFYRKLGYETCFFRGREEIAVPACTGEVRAISPEAYFNLRELLLPAGFVSLPATLLGYQGTSDRLCRIETENDVFCAVCAESAGRLTVKELLPYSPAAAALLLRESGCRQGVCLTPEGDIPYGMGKPLSEVPLPAHIYLGLAMD